MSEALAHAHKKHIVHSDFKPGNVFLTKDAEVKVLDFGIARAVPTGLKPDADRTVFDAGSLGALTPPYASAEMLRGAEPAPADDVYALGVVAYELLTGRHPYDREPADSARLRGLVPAPVPGITWRQRKALKRALSLERADRQADAGLFLREFNGPTPIRRSAYAAMLVLSALLVYAIHENMQIRPDVPFDALRVEDQQRFLDAIADGDEAFGIDLAGALDYYSSAYDIHRNNPDAIAGLQKVARRTLEQVETADAGLQQRAIATLMCQEYLSTYRPVVKACEAALGESRCAAEATRCAAGRAD
jgi:serine/threonine protein kinase